MTFPTIEEVTATNLTATAATSHVVNMPSTVNANDLLICFIWSRDDPGNGDDTNTYNTPSGWTQILQQTGNFSDRFGAFYKVASGSEDGTTVTWTTSSNCWTIAHVYRIRQGTYQGTPEGASAGSAAGSTDPPNLNPSGWGTEDTLWIVSGGQWGATGGSSAPTNYTSDAATTGSNSVSLKSSHRELNAASQNPGTFATSASWCAATIAVRPAAGVTLKSLAGNQPNATGSLALKKYIKSLAGNQPSATGALTVRRTLTHISLAGNQAAPSGAIAAIKKQFKSLSGNQPSATGALAFKRTLTHITLAGNQPAGSGTVAAVRAKFISLAGNQPSATGALVALFKNKLLQGAQAAPSGSLAFDRLLTHISLAGNQAAPSGAIAAVSATFVDLAGNQPAATGALVALFTNKLLQGNQPNATGLLAAVHIAFIALAGDQPAGSGTVVGVAPVRNYTPSPYGGSARAILLPPGASGRVSDVRPSPGTVRTNNPPSSGSGRFTP